MRKSIYLISSSLAHNDLKFVRADNESTEVSYGYFQDNGNGVYVVGEFNIPDYSYNIATNTEVFSVVEVLPKVNGTIQRSFDNLLVWSDNLQGGYRHNPVTIGDMAARLHKYGDTMYEYITDEPTGSFTALNPTDYQHINKKYMVDYISGSLQPSGSYVTTNTTQTITGAKTFTNNVLFNIGTANSRFKIVDEDEITGSTTLLDLLWRSGGRSVFDFKNSHLSLSGSIAVSSSASFINPIMPTSSPYYSTPSLNSLITRNWVTNHFVSIGGGYNSNTVIVDSLATPITGAVYTSIQAAITDLSISADVSNIYTIVVKQHIDSQGYQENIIVPDWINIVGEGLVRIGGTVSRTGSQPLSSKLENLHFSVDGSHAVDRFDATNCIFESISDNVVLSSSRAKMCCFIAGSSVTSSGGNNLLNCYGNYNISFQLTDGFTDYKYRSGFTYNF